MNGTGANRKRSRSAGTYRTRKRQVKVPAKTQASALFGVRKTGYQEWSPDQDRLVRIRQRFAITMVVNVRVRTCASPNPLPGAPIYTQRMKARTTKPWSRLKARFFLVNNPSSFRRGGRCHHVCLLLFRFEHDRAGRVDDQLQEDDMHRAAGQGAY